MSDFEKAMEKARQWRRYMGRGDIMSIIDALAAAHAEVVEERDLNLWAATELAEFLYARMKDLGSIEESDSPEAFLQQALSNAAEEAVPD